MTVAEAASAIQAVVVTGAEGAATREVSGGYVSDLLSDVMANATEGNVWVTLQRHVNVVAVAHLKGIAAIVLVNGRQPEPATLERAIEQHACIMTTPLPAWEVTGILWNAGIRAR